MPARHREIDIAVDLNGFTQNAKTGIFALRPAPVQVNYSRLSRHHGYGLYELHHRRRLRHPPQSRAHYAESVALSCPIASRLTTTGGSGSKKYLRERNMVCRKRALSFALNANAKLTPALFDVWMRVLNSVPAACCGCWAMRRCSVTCALKPPASGVEPSRLIFASRVPYEEHLLRLMRRFPFLDTLPFNAGTTASDVLWAGLPLLTCAGETFASRMAGSLLTAIGLPELITEKCKRLRIPGPRTSHPPRATATLRNLRASTPTAPLSPLLQHRPLHPPSGERLRHHAPTRPARTAGGGLSGGGIG